MPDNQQGQWKKLVAKAREKSEKEAAELAAAQAEKEKLSPEGQAAGPSVRAEARRMYREYFQRYRYVWLAASLVVLALSLLIAFPPDDRPTRVHVSGQVLLDGKPVTNTTIVFIPEQGRSSAATLDEQGRFTLSCFDGEDGAIPGRYQIELSMAQVPSKTDPPWPVPRIYTDHATSGLTAEISKSTDDLVIRLDAESEKPAAPAKPDVPPLRPEGR